MGRNNSEAWDTIHSMCDYDKINEKLLYERSKLVLSKYRKLCWQSRLDANDSINDICLIRIKSHKFQVLLLLTLNYSIQYFNIRVSIFSFFIFSF